MIPETAFRGDGVAVGSVDSYFETVVLKPVDRIFNGPGVGLGPVLIETNADINIAHPGGKGMAVQKQRRKARCQGRSQASLMRMPKAVQGLFRLSRDGSVEPAELPVKDTLPYADD